MEVWNAARTIVTPSQVAEETDLDAEVTPVHVVAEEQVLCGGRRSAHLEQLHQVVELPVDVAAH